MLSGIESQYDPRHRDRIQRSMVEHRTSSIVVDVALRRLDTILVENGIDRVDVLSIDVEGGDLGVLDSIDLSRFDVQVVALENNYRSWSLARRMRDQGYQLLCRIGSDELYVPRTVRL
jgi:hypothetical protein